MTNSDLSAFSPTFVHRPTHIEVHADALVDNLRAIRARVNGARVMASVKANGYGHGLVTVGRILQGAGVDALGVAYVEEAIELRQAGITVPVLVFGGLMREQVELYILHGVDLTASSVSKVEQINEAAKRLGRRARIHLKIDTGLERIGVHYYNSQSLFDAALRADWCDVVGVYSHFARVEREDMSLARLQLERFLESLRYFQGRAKGEFLRHIANSGGSLLFPECHLDMVRPGLALYGVFPDQQVKAEFGLKPTLSLKSRVVYFKVVKQGAGVSYDHSWVAPQDTRVVTVPIGYGDGYLRALSNRAPVLIRGVRHRIVGKVCMDQLMVDISPTGVAYNDDEVVLIGSQGGESITVEELAGLIETTPHEILALLNQRIPRFVQQG